MTQTTKTSRYAAVTASYSGIGFELCRALLKNGYALIRLDRDPTKSAKAERKLRAEFPRAHIATCQIDLAEPSDFARVAREVAAKTDHLDRLFHVAGAATPALSYAPSGNEMHYQVNTIAPVRLTLALAPLLQAAPGAVVVAVGSSAMKMARRLDLAELAKPTRFKKMSGPYAHSKLALAAAFAALSESFGDAGPAQRVADPGVNRTNMSSSAAMPGLVRLIQRWFPHPAAGAARILAAADAPEFQGQTGIYIERGKIAALPHSASDAAKRAALLDAMLAATQAEAA